MSASLIKLYVSNFVMQILRNDANKFGFIKKDNQPNINGFLNKLIPNLVKDRKHRREEILNVLENEFVRGDAQQIYECVNTVIDRVYFTDEELDQLEDRVWFHPAKKNKAIFDEIETSEAEITLQSPSVYIRGLLNEYARFSEYKREAITFEEERLHFAEASETGQIFHAEVNGKLIRVFAFCHTYEWTYNQANYLIGYDLTNKLIGAIPLCTVRDSYLVERKYKPSNNLIDILQKYYEDRQYSVRLPYEEVSAL